ncbi:MAG: 4-hydroxyphenylpyruvate dioxygenase [Gammaproteobacteria bacterium]|nr:4-hydroxyphenylpyruvate dioxygenase [Gammaproteobacteria bacterium]
MATNRNTVMDAHERAGTVDNPMGGDGFEFIEFSAPEAGVLEPVFRMLGFERVALHRSKAVELWRQGGINFVINYEPKSAAWYFAREHGPCACGLAFRVRDARCAYARALRLGAEPIDNPCGPMELRLPSIRNIGGAALYLIDRWEDGSSIYDIDFSFLPDADRHPPGVGLEVIDHLTHNVYRGRMDHWANYYERLFNFREIRRFQIQGQETGLVSRAMAAPDGKVRIPLNEEAVALARSHRSGQIEEFLIRHNGEGIQHIALGCDDLLTTCDRLHKRGLPFMDPPPHTYYQALDQRLPGHGEPVAELAQRGILLDGSTDDGPRLLLQIFSADLIGPTFFEFIQRKRDDGFGEGNFQALFEAIERDQLRREDTAQAPAAHLANGPTVKESA